MGNTSAPAIDTEAAPGAPPPFIRPGNTALRPNCNKSEAPINICV